MQTQTNPHPHHARRWAILGVIGLAQLMVVLDATIVNIALPSAQEALGFSDENRQWIVTAYALAFGSLLLLGGKIGDLFGRKRVFIAGLIGFAVASAIGGAAESFGMLVASRALQGVFGALLAPAALSLLTTTFTDPAERAKAFAIYGGIAGAGGAVGLLLGGVLTEYLSWRWCLYVNLAFAGVAAAGASRLLVRTPQTGERPVIDLPGVVTSAAGLFLLVFGFSRAETDGWAAALTIGSLALSAVLLAAFVLIERRSEHPLLPLGIVLDRARGGSFLAVLLSGAGMFAIFLFLTYYMQTSLGMSPIETGFAFLPMIGCLAVTAAISTTRLLPKFGPRALVVAGMLLAAGGMVALTGLTVESTYAGHILPSLVPLGIGMGLIIAPSMQTATLGVAPKDAGVASATVNTSQQVGGSVGTALLSTLAASAVTSSIGGKAATPEVLAVAAVDGYTTAFAWAAGIFLLGAVLCGALLPGGVVAHDPASEPVFAH